MKNCHCGKPLHYRNKKNEALVNQIIDIRGEFVPVQVGGRTWNVSRHYIALHGLRGKDLHKLGFKEIV